MSKARADEGSVDAAEESQEPRREGARSRQRVQLDFSAEAYDRLIELKDLSGAASNGEVVRKALQVFEWVLRKRQENSQLLVEKGGTVREVELLV